MSEEESKTLTQATIEPPSVVIDDDISTVGIYLEVPTQSRRRRSRHSSSCGDVFGETNLLSNVRDSRTTSIDDGLFDDDLFDSPRLFTEIVKLTEDEQKQQTWHEAARWVRFEEEVEEGGQRWSKPHVSTLSLHSFFELRSLLLSGTVALDIEGNTVEEIFNSVLSNASAKGKLQPSKIKKIQETLKCKCVHLFEVIRNAEVIKSTTKKPHKNKKKKETNEATPEEQGPLYEGGEETGIYEGNKHFLKKLPEGAEAANILVGEVKYLDSIFCAFVRLKEGINLGSFTEVPIVSRFVFLLLGPMGEMPRYSEIGRSFATLLSDDVFREVAYKGRTMSHLLAGMDEFLDASTLLPPGEWDPTTRIEPPQAAPTKESRKKKLPFKDVDEHEEERKLREESGLIRTGVLFGGLINDLKRKAPWYLSDFKDGISMQSLATFCFLYFACLAPMVTFGGLLGEATGNSISVMEHLIAALICGVTFGLLSGQPLNILGSTGPVLVFESIMYDFCGSYEWNYLSFRLWIGLWSALILLLLVAVDASAFVCYITRFTEENFATLIALIYIYKAVEKVISIGDKYPPELNVNYEKLCTCLIDDGEINGTELNVTYAECNYINGTIIGDDCHKYYADVFMLSLLLFIGTFFIAISLKNFKKTGFFPTKVRQFISDFAIIIAILIMTLIDMQLGINTPKLLVPSEVKPTSPNRGWIIPPFNGNPWWTSLLAFVPALLACILIFMDQQITAVIVNRKENKLKKGGGYHLDLTVLAVLIAVNSFMGLPWFVAATVDSINHVNSLKLESQCAAPGECPHFLGVRENRVTQVSIFFCIGMSAFLAPMLRHIPMAVLFGVFMYMGIAALGGIQFFERIQLMFMPVKFQPDRTFLRQVPLHRVHIYTCVQLACLIVMWIIKSVSSTSILFPLMLIIMIGVRKLLDCFFTQRELKILDDILPEFSRKEILEEEEEHGDDGEKDVIDPKRARLLSISLVNGGSSKSPSLINNFDISEEVNKTELWSTIEKGLQAPPGSNTDPRKLSASSIVKNRRRSSILEPIFGRHNYNLPAQELKLDIPMVMDEDQQIVITKIAVHPE